jgi:hypothetical protein
LFDEDPGGLALDVNFGTERSRTCAAGSWRHQNHRTRQEFVGLDDNAEAVAVLLVADAFGDPEPMDVTPEHAATP